MSRSSMPTRTTDAPAAPRALSRGSTWAVILLLFVPGILVAVSLAAMYVVVKPLVPIVGEYYFVQQAETYATYWLPLYVHVIGGAVALIAAAFNLVSGLRRRARRAHRITGVAYVAAVAVSAPAGFVLAFHAYGGRMPAGDFVATSGFALLAVAWFATTALALRAILRGDRTTHGFWMILSFSLVFAAVTLRIYLSVLMGIGEDAFEFWYPALGWLCWVPNVLVALPFALRRTARDQERTDAATRRASASQRSVNTA